MEEEYEMQHYDFSISQLKQETASMIKEEVDKACGLLVSSIIISPDVDTNVASEIDRKKNILANDIKTLLKESFDKIGNIMTENFSIPANVTLSTDQYQLKCMNTSEEQLQEHYDELLQKFISLEQFSSNLNDELDIYKQMEHLMIMQGDAIEMAEETMSTHPDFNYIKELAASVKLEKFSSNLNDELEIYREMTNLIIIQDDAIVMPEAPMSTHPDLNYIKKLKEIGNIKK